MANTKFLQFGPLPESALNSLSVETAVQEAAQAIQGTSTPRDFLIGSIVQNRRLLQVISEGPQLCSAALDSTNSTDSLWCVPNTSFTVAFERSLFATNEPATGQTVEYVQHFFPASQVTPAFKAQIEQDFRKFNEGFSRELKGRVNWSFGWTLEDLDHADIRDEKAMSFVIVVGWESMVDFEQAIQREAFRSSIDILIAWNAPYKMWHSERKALL